MVQMGFDARWIRLIMMCVSSAKYSVLVNGAPCGHILPSRGIRQGDPISPYLFLICAEALSSMLTRANNDGSLSGIPTSKRGPHISHLFFADDSLLFCRANILQWNNLADILKKYEVASGQKMNNDKTSVFFSKNTSLEERSRILELAAIPNTQRYDTYLGLPALVGKSRTTAFRSIIERVRKRLQDWKLKFLSQAGKEILLKAVIQAIPAYCMNIFLLPKNLCKEINSLMQRFWWGRKDKEKGIAWMKWSHMGLSKKRGGMGFRDFTSFNMALLAKQGWRMLKSPDSLIARIMKAKYFPNCSILEATQGRNPSFAWRSIQKSCSLLKEGLVWRVGNGATAKIWQDRWMPNLPTCKITTPPTLLAPSATVKELIDPDSKNWNYDLLVRLFSNSEVKNILTIPLCRTNQDDVLIWRGTTKGVFSVRSAYHMHKELEEADKPESSSTRATNSAVWDKLWKLHIPNVEKNFLWKACHDILPTRANLFKRKITEDSRCPICGLEAETTLHILWQCPSAMGVWSEGGRKIQKRAVECQSFLHVVEGVFQECDSEDIRIFVGVARRLWLRRNELIYEGNFVPPKVLMKLSIDGVIDYSKANEKMPPTTPMDRTSGWITPPPGWIVAHWDAAIDGVRGRLGLGVVLRDREGRFIAGRSLTRQGHVDAVVAEAYAALEAIQLGWDLGYEKVHFMGDAKVIINAVNAGEPDWSRIGHLIQDICTNLNVFLQWKFTHVYRENNGPAHVLAKLGTKQNMDKLWVSYPPTCIRDLIACEQSGLSL
jgi:ribonuclease HI